MIIAATPFQGTAVERLRYAMELRRQAGADEMRAIAELAAEHSWTTTDEYDVIGERPVRLADQGVRRPGELDGGVRGQGHCGSRRATMVAGRKQHRDTDHAMGQPFPT